ncbi:MAG: intracellular sulfur oxidation DsrE/DsrF family protein [Marivirga sp.]|jgi:intracellular sulfur oxidation DsrE/DsrF family protein
MNRIYSLTLLPFLLILIVPVTLKAQEKQFPLVKEFGGVYKIEGAVELPSPDKSHKIIIELVSGNKKPDEPSFWINNVARMMNLHGVAGVNKENIQVKVVVHGGAVLDIVVNERYLTEHEIENNPNLLLLKYLQEAGAEIIVCGQSLLAREITTEELAPGTKVALSALTTISKNVPEGYVLFKF